MFNISGGSAELGGPQDQQRRGRNHLGCKSTAAGEPVARSAFLLSHSNGWCKPVWPLDGVGGGLGGSCVHTVVGSVYTLGSVISSWLPSRFPCYSPHPRQASKPSRLTRVGKCERGAEGVPRWALAGASLYYGTILYPPRTRNDAASSVAGHGVVPIEVGLG